RCFHVREQRQLGFYVFLAACKRDNADAILSEYPDEPLAQYLAVHSSPVLRKHAAQWAINSVKAGDGFLQHLGLTHALYQRWESDRVLKTASDRLKVERQKAFDYVKKHKDSAFGWGMLCLLEDRAAEARAAGADRPGTDAAYYRELADAFRLFVDSPALGYAARYEEARCMLRAGARAEAKKHFHDLYADTFKKESLPLIDADARRAMLGQDGGADWWSDILRRTAKQMIDKKNRAAVLALAWQCWQLDDQPMAN